MVSFITEQSMSPFTGDFPDINRMKKILTESDFNDFPRLNEAMLDVVDDMMKYDIPHLMKKLPQEQNSFKSEKTESD